MTNARMIQLLQTFFDGFIEGPEDVVRYTGLQPADAQEVYDAIQYLRSTPYHVITRES